METIKTFKEKKGKKILKIFVDENPQNPREWDNVGKMVCFHKRYDLGDETDLRTEDFVGWEDLKQFLYKEKNAVIVLPLYLYDHSGLRIKIGSFQGLLPQGHAEFDSGQVGFIYVDRQTLIDEKLVGKGKKAENILKQEVETYNQYLSGNVYGFQVVTNKKCKTCGHTEEEVIDSCLGFLGNNVEKEIFDYVGLDINKFKEIE